MCQTKKGFNISCLKNKNQNILRLSPFLLRWLSPRRLTTVPSLSSKLQVLLSSCTQVTTKAYFYNLVSLIVWQFHLINQKPHHNHRFVCLFIIRRLKFRLSQLLLFSFMIQLRWELRVSPSYSWVKSRMTSKSFCTVENFQFSKITAYFLYIFQFVNRIFYIWFLLNDDILKSKLNTHCEQDLILDCHNY